METDLYGGYWSWDGPGVLVYTRKDGVRFRHENHPPAVQAARDTFGPCVRRVLMHPEQRQAWDGRAGVRTETYIPGVTEFESPDGTRRLVEVYSPDDYGGAQRVNARGPAEEVG